MTITTEVPLVEYTGDGSQTVFSLAPIVLQEPKTGQPNDLEVVVFNNATGVTTQLSEGTGTTNYSVQVSSYPGTGNVTYPATLGTELTADEKLTIKRKVSLEQQTKLNNQGGYLPKVQEGQFDRFSMTHIQQQEEIDRSLRVPLSAATSFNGELVVTGDPANKFPRVNGTGTNWELVENIANAPPSDATPEDVIAGVATGTPGTSTDYSRSDHVHGGGGGGAGGVPVGGSFETEPPNGTPPPVFTRLQILDSITFPADLAGTVFAVETNPTSEFNVEIQANGTVVGLIEIDDTGTGFLSTPGNIAQVIPANAVITFQQDNGAADGGITGFSCAVAVT